MKGQRNTVRITRALLHHRCDAMQSRERNLLLDLSGVHKVIRVNNEVAREARHRAIRRLRVSPAIRTLKIPEILLDHGFKSHILSAYLNEYPDCAALSNRGSGEARRGSRIRKYLLRK